MSSGVLDRSLHVTSSLILALAVVVSACGGGDDSDIAADPTRDVADDTPADDAPSADADEPAATDPGGSGDVCGGLITVDDVETAFDVEVELAESDDRSCNWQLTNGERASAAIFPSDLGAEFVAGQIAQVAELEGYEFLPDDRGFTVDVSTVVLTDDGRAFQFQGPLTPGPDAVGVQVIADALRAG